MFPCCPALRTRRSRRRPRALRSAVRKSYFESRSLLLLSRSRTVPLLINLLIPFNRKEIDVIAETAIDTRNAFEFPSPTESLNHSFFTNTHIQMFQQWQARRPDGRKWHGLPSARFAPLSASSSFKVDAPPFQPPTRPTGLFHFVPGGIKIPTVRRCACRSQTVGTSPNELQQVRSLRQSVKPREQAGRQASPRPCQANSNRKRRRKEGLSQE